MKGVGFPHYSAFVTHKDAEAAADAGEGGDVWCSWDVDDMLVLSKDKD